MRQQQVTRRVRVRSKSLAEVDETKLTLAVWLLAKQIVAEQVELDTGDDPPESRPPQRVT